jgi:hypothetical protein
MLERTGGSEETVVYTKKIILCTVKLLPGNLLKTVVKTSREAFTSGGGIQPLRGFQPKKYFETAIIGRNPVLLNSLPPKTFNLKRN